MYVSLRANRAAHNVVTRKPRSACQHGTRARIFKRYGALAAEQSNHISAFHRHSADRTLVALCGAVHATHHVSAGRKGGADGAAAADGAFVRECQWLVVVCLVRLCSVHCHSALRRRSASMKVVVVVKEVRESAACPQIGLELAEVAGSFRRERHYPNAVARIETVDFVKILPFVPPNCHDAAVPVLQVAREQPQGRRQIQGPKHPRAVVPVLILHLPERSVPILAVPQEAPLHGYTLPHGAGTA